MRLLLQPASFHADYRDVRTGWRKRNVFLGYELVINGTPHFDEIPSV